MQYEALPCTVTDAGSRILVDLGRELSGLVEQCTLVNAVYGFLVAFGRFSVLYYLFILQGRH